MGDVRSSWVANIVPTSAVSNSEQPIRINFDAETVRSETRSMPARRRKTLPTAFDPSAVRAVYQELASRPLERRCELRTTCCHFRLTGKLPHLTRGEALLAARALRATGRPSLPQHPDGACPLLHPSTARCLIYEDRPFACRTHFCPAAGGPWPRAAVIDLIHRLENLDTQLGGDGPRTLPGALQTALQLCR